ncbi:MAG TPA: aldo/keto reductase [Methanocorpusculum sp.]|nr:aldo/keto reductase [Methanocorpusculum sp.]
MITHPFKNIRLPALGLGMMRLPVVNGNDAEPDQKKVNEMVSYAMAHGLTYFDTGPGYHGKQCERVTAAALAPYPRSSYYLAVKFLGYDISDVNRVEEVFSRQLKTFHTDYFDFYLMQNVCESNIAYYLDEKYRIHSYLKSEKDAGRITYLGFSAHGKIDVMEQFLEKYGADMDFCQIQLNWLDYEFQDAKEKLALLEKYHLPVFVMEPLRGGKLAHLSPDAEKTLAAFRKQSSAAWALQYLQSIPQVAVVLSGMSDMAQLKENIAVMSEFAPASDEEKRALYAIAREMTKGVPCTSCRYCVDHCPNELDIPLLINTYNEYKFTNGGFVAPHFLASLAENKRPSACEACGACEKACPQRIKISEVMADFCTLAGYR